MTDAALLLHTATALEKMVASGRRHRRDQPDARYWEGADDAIAWVLDTLRGRGDQLAKDSARIERLRTFATRASTGGWRVEHDDNESTLLAGEVRLGMLQPEAADYLQVAQPGVVLALLNALHDPTAPAPDTRALEEAALLAPRGPWTYVGCVLFSRDSVDIGWLHFSHDVDYVAAASPQFLLHLTRTLRIVRGA